MEWMQEGLLAVAEFAILLQEWIGVVIIMVSGLFGLVNYVRRDPMTRLNLAKGLAAGLEFKLGSEIVRTVVVRDFHEIATVGLIIALRAALTVLIHWEIRNEEREMSKKEKK